MAPCKKKTTCCSCWFEAHRQTVLSSIVISWRIIFTVFSVGWCLSVRPEQSPPTFCTSSPGSRRFIGSRSATESQFDWLPGEVMRRFVYCKVVLTTSLVWVLVDVFLLLYFSECNKCDDRKDGSLLPALRGESTPPPLLHLTDGSLPTAALHWPSLSPDMAWKL